MSDTVLEPPIGARVRLLGGELGTVVAHVTRNVSIEVELDDGRPARRQWTRGTEYIDPQKCSEPECNAWSAVEAIRTAWALEHPRGAARRMELGHAPFCFSHAPQPGKVWAAVKPIGEGELPRPGLSRRGCTDGVQPRRRPSAAASRIRSNPYAW